MFGDFSFKSFPLCKNESGLNPVYCFVNIVPRYFSDTCFSVNPSSIKGNIMNSELLLTYALNSDAALLFSIDILKLLKLFK